MISYLYVNSSVSCKSLLHALSEGYTAYVCLDRATQREPADHLIVAVKKISLKTCIVAQAI